ncbi:MAG: tetratricopeptide repeat protein [Novosphingobium sp.]|nr:tetratricopeptide repeat protein [Novosphingobium sp.]
MREALRRARWLPVLAALLCLAAPLRLAASPERSTALIAEARKALDGGDGIAAEVRLRQAMDAGAPREAVAALMGEAFLIQDQRDKARQWLADGQFSPETAALGFRALGRLELLDENLPASAAAFDHAIALTPRDATMWVEIGRMRYAGREHTLALAASDYALTLDPGNVRALEFHALIVRDRDGALPALPWFRRALAKAPQDMAVLGEYAATLGELGRAREMLAVTRKMIGIDGSDPLPSYLQAVLAARAGNFDLARRLYGRTSDRMRDVPGAMLLEGVLELHAGNHVLAVEALQRLTRIQPANARARLLLARAEALAGEDRLVLHDFADEAARAGAAPYLVVQVARAHEADGRRDLAAPLLDRAALGQVPPLSPVATGSPIGALLADGNNAQALTLAEGALAQHPGAVENAVLAGDVQLATGHPDAALARYRQAARVRLPQSLLLRMIEACRQSGDGAMAARIAQDYLARNPASPLAARLVAGFAVDRGDWRRAAMLLAAARAAGGAGDVRLLAALARAQLRVADVKAAEATAREAYRLQRASPAATAAWADALAALGGNDATVAALRAKQARLGVPAPS